MRETRNHWSGTELLENLPKQQRELALKAGRPPEFTIIRREWYPLGTEPRSRKLDAATRLVEVVLVDPALDHVKFSWSKDWDIPKGPAIYRLRIWYAADRQEQIGVRVEYPPIGNDFGSFRAKARLAFEKGVLPGDDELLLTVDLAGRKWTLPVGEWRRGEVGEEGKAWLASVTSSELKQALQAVKLLGHVCADLDMAVQLVARPLLGEYGKAEPVVPEHLVVARGKPDCDFDAWFGEPCSLAQQLEFNLRKNPQLAPPK